MSDLASGLRLAVGTLTVVPVGTIPEPTHGHARWAMVLAPLAALPLAAGVAAVVAGGRLAQLPPLVTAALAVGLVALGTRAMHLDGLADTVDGIGAGWTRERALEVMRAGDVGPMGVAALVLALLLQVASLASVVTLPHAWLLAGLVVVVSRAALLLACRRGMPSARPSGLGTVVAGSVPTSLAVGCGAVITVVVALAAWPAGLSPWSGVVAVLGAGASVALLLRTCRRVFGGVSGDVMGAAIEVAFTVLLVVLGAGSW